MNIKISLALLLAALFIFSSCTPVQDREIKFKNIADDLDKILLENSELESEKSAYLEKLIAFYNGRNAYLKYINERLTNDFIDKNETLFISEEDFNKKVGLLSEYFRTNQITYKVLFSEFDSINSIIDSHNLEAQSIYGIIDSVCVRKQKYRDSLDVQIREQIEKLNAIVDIKMTNFSWRIESPKSGNTFSDLTINLRITNNSKHSIEAIDFDLVVFDKLDNRIARIPFTTYKTINRSMDVSRTYYWQGNLPNHSEIRDGLWNQSILKVSTRQRINKVNVSGKVFSRASIENQLSYNKNYVTSTKLNGNCPYLDYDNEYFMILKQLREVKERNIESATPTIQFIDDLLSKIM
ncbi:MAG: hypothetical protein LAT54_10250 [Cryomorphaceae bacterium]|nr:hypothetical protein [Cryomorphaceae bacterium]